MGVLSRMPFTAFENENVSSHAYLIDQYLTPSSVVHSKQILEFCHYNASKFQPYLAYLFLVNLA